MITITEFHVIAYTVFVIFVISTLYMVRSWKSAIKEGVAELAQIAQILKDHQDIEERDEKLAQILGMTKDELRIELEQKDRLQLVAQKIEATATRLKSIFPINYNRM